MKLNKKEKVGSKIPKKHALQKINKVLTQKKVKNAIDKGDIGKELAQESTKPKKKPKKISKDVETPPKKFKSKNSAKVDAPTGEMETVKAKAKKKKMTSHKKDLEGLKDIDPEFYKFLQQNDKKLLEFNMFDSDSDEDDDDNVTKKGINDNSDDEDVVDEENSEEKAAAEENSEDEAAAAEKFHKPTGDLDVASDESDFEEDDADDDSSQKITIKLLRNFELQLQQNNVSIDVIRKAIQAFSSALASISEEDSKHAAYQVTGAAAFNGVIQLCVLHLYPAILRALGLTAKSKTPLHKTKKWTKVRGCLRYYLMDLIRLIEHVSSPNILSVLLKHLHQMSSMVSSFSSICKTMLKRLIVLWATSDETVRVLAFLCILKITRNQQVSMLNHVLKAMYLSYVRNSKFVSPNTLPGINFMRRSLVEMFALDLNVTYQHAFLYIRQLAIHLRNAVILKKKDSFQSVYNWQYVNSIRLWADLLGTTTNKPQLQPLVYPLVTITTGVVKLVPTAQYFPLRFHCVHALISLAKQTNTFIPVLPFILEVLKSNTFNKKHTTVSMKPMQFTCVLRLNKSQMSENGFRDEVIENVCGLMLEYLAHESASLAFADLVVPAVVALKQYLKECRNANYSRKIKQVLDKIQENAKFIENERRKVNFSLKEIALVQSWETQVRNKGSPLNIYYESWVKTHETKKRRQAANTDNINDYDLPMIKRKKAGSEKEVCNNSDGEVELFPSDSEDDAQLPIGDGGNEEEEIDQNATHAKPSKKEKKQKKKKSDKLMEPEVLVEEDTNDYVDIVKDLDLDDW